MERSDEESVLLRGFLFFRSCSLSQILRCAQDDTTSRLPQSANRVILRKPQADEESVLLRGWLFSARYFPLPGGRWHLPKANAGEGTARHGEEPLSLAALDSSPGRGAKCLAVLLRGWLLFRSLSPSQILRHFVPQDDKLCSFRVICWGCHSEERSDEESVLYPSGAF